MTKFDNSDQRLRNALSNREESVMEMVTHSFKGRTRWLMVTTWVKMLFFALSCLR